MSENSIPHKCSPSWAQKLEYSGGYGEAIHDCWEDGNGELWVANWEYSSRVNFCPYCGYKAPKTVSIK